MSVYKNMESHHQCRGGQMGAKEPIMAPPGFLVALGLSSDNLLA